MGAENLLIFGTCGVLDSNIKETSIIIPTSAIRDEVTSYHYAPPASKIALNHTYRKQFKQFLDAQNISYTEGKVWTTDGIYRETHQKTANRKTQGASPLIWNALQLPHLPTSARLIIFNSFIRLTI